MTRNEKRSIDLYSRLSSKQKASVALGIYDADELALIAGTVERKTYKMMDAQFTDWSEYAFKISTVLGLSYWQSRSVEYKLKHGVRGAALVADDERIDEAKTELERELMATVIAAIPKAKANQKAALEALRVLAQENGFQFEDCLKLADIAIDEVDQLEDVDPNPDRLDYYLTTLREIAPAD